MRDLDLDPGIASVVDFVREVHTPIHEATRVGVTVPDTDYAYLSGAVHALLNAIDARLPERQQATAAKAVAA
jgi:hypothetical protein